MMLYLPVI